MATGYVKVGEKLSDFTFIEDSYFSIVTKYSQGSLPYNRTSSSLKDTTNDAAALLESVLSDDYYTWYSLWGLNYGSNITNYYIEKTTAIVPSIFKGYSEVNSLMADKTANYDGLGFFYIPSLKVLIQAKQTGGFVAALDSNGVVTDVSSGGSLFLNVWNGQPRCLSVINYTDGMDLKTATFEGIRCAVFSNSKYEPLAVKDTYLADSISYWEQIISLLFRVTSIPDYAGGPIDPYEPGGTSGPSDLPPGTFDDDSDPIPDSSLPTLSAANTGFTRIYNPTLAQVQSLAQYLWTSDNIVETLWNKVKQFFDDPMQAIIGFNLVPVPVPDAGSEEFTVMYIGTGVYLNVAANQFVDVDCGTLEIKRYYGSALDQSPNTKISCFLPFIGTVQLNCDEVMGTTLQVKYRVDIVSGSCVAKVFVDGSCLYQYSGHCAITIPFSSADFSNYVNAAIQVAKLVGTAIAGGAGALMAAGVSDVEQETNYVVTRITDTVHTNKRGVVSGSTHQVQTTSYPQQQESSQTRASFAGLSPANIANTVAQVVSSKPVIEHSGSFSGNSGYLGIRRPFVIIERPNMCLPSNYQALNGYPAMITMTLGDCKGYTRVQQVQLTGLTATNPEQAEILQLLKSGVVF